MTSRIGLFILAVAGAIIVFFALQGYLTPMSGIAGTPGPILAAVGGGALIIGALVLAILAPGGLRSLMHFLVILALIGCGLCGWFLLTPAITIGALIGAAGFFLYLAAIGGQHKRKLT